MRISDWSSDVCSSDLLVHVRLEGARRDRGDDDMILHQPRREALGEVEDRRLRRVIAVGFPRVEAHAIDRADVDDLCGTFVRASGLEQPVQRLGQEKGRFDRSEEHTSEIQSLMRNSYAVFCLKKKK